jgi:hypothetical protein
LAVGLGVALPALAQDVQPEYGVPSTGSGVQFTPDRPGVGDSTGTPGKGHVMVEGGLALTPSPDPGAYGTSGIVGRFGVDDGLELRLRAPDLTLGDGLSVGTVGIGAKVAASAGRWSVSAVPELAIDPNTGDLGGGVGANLAVGFGVVGFWGHGSVALLQNTDPSVLMGGGASVAVGPGGFFANGGATAAGPGFGGGGAWLGLGNRAQLDAGCDVWVAGGDVLPTIGLGASVGF